MLRKGLISALVCAFVVLFALSAGGVDIKGGKAAQGKASGALAVFTFTDTEGSYNLPSAYTFWTKDGSGFYITRTMDGTKEAVPFWVPAGKSILIPNAVPTLSAGTWTATITISSHADSVYCLPWSE